MKNKNLFLIVTKYWYEKIASGEKRVEYREDTNYWRNKFLILKPSQEFINTGNALCGFRFYKTVEFQLGYSRKYPRLKFHIIYISINLTPKELKNTIKTEYCFHIYFKERG